MRLSRWQRSLVGLFSFLAVLLAIGASAVAAQQLAPDNDQILPDYTALEPAASEATDPAAEHVLTPTERDPGRDGRSLRVNVGNETAAASTSGITPQAAVTAGSVSTSAVAAAEPLSEEASPPSSSTSPVSARDKARPVVSPQGPSVLTTPTTARRDFELLASTTSEPRLPSVLLPLETTTTPTTMPPTTPPPRSSTTTTENRPGRRLTGDVIDLDSPSVLFFSDNEDCVGIDGSQRHPDWTAGQLNSTVNSDGTPTYGFAYNTGDATIGQIDWGFLSDSRALSGDCVLSMSVAGADTSRRAVRIFRRYDRAGRALPPEAYYSVWFYFPQEISYERRATVDGRTQYGYWNVFQLKNKVNGQSLANLSVNAGKPVGDSHMSFSIWRKSECGAVEECSKAATILPIVDRPIPVGQWVHLEMYVDARTDNAGKVIVWQDGEKVIDFSGQTMRSGTERQAWSVNNYGILHRPGSHTLLVDDVLISTEAVHTRLFE